MAQRDDEKSKPQPSWARTAGGTHDQLLEENWLFRLRKERFESRHTGQVHDYYVLDLADAVHVVALTPDGEVLLVRAVPGPVQAATAWRSRGDSLIRVKIPARRASASCSRKQAMREILPCCSARSGRIPRC